MTNNMAMGDRIIRILLAVTILILYLSGTIHGFVAILLGVVAAVFVFTGIIGWCPLYSALGISTRRGMPRQA